MKYTERSLREYLLSLGVPVELWGKGEAKTLKHLVKELKKGECELDNTCRTVRTLALDVWHKELQLREACQVFSDDRIRIRKMPWGSVGEKLVNGEEPIKGLWRALEEELGIRFDGRIRIKFLGEATLISLSGSYPGLTTKNFQTRYRIKIPAEFFRPNGYFENQPDKTTYFDWIPTE